MQLTPERTDEKSEAAGWVTGFQDILRRLHALRSADTLKREKLHD